MNAVETVKLKRIFGQLTAVDDLDLTVGEGIFFGFLGPNGAGKSTTIKMLTGLLTPTSGRASILGYDVASQAVEVKRRIGVVPEELALFDRLTGPEYLSFVGRMFGLRRSVIRQRSRELLELMDLDGDRKKLIAEFSHGMKKKLSLSAALMHEPRVLFLDEPFEGIDAIASRLIKDLLAALVNRGVTVFLTSHILEIVEKLCSEIAIIHRGGLVARGSLDTLRAGVAVEDRGAGARTMTLEELFLNTVDADDHPRRTLSWLE